MPIPQERTELRQFLLELPGPQFESVVFTLRPPRGNVAPAKAPQADRVSDLLEWLESPIGPGLDALRAALEKEINRHGNADPEAADPDDGTPGPPPKRQDELRDFGQPRQPLAPLRPVALAMALVSGLAVASLVSIARFLGAFEPLEMGAYNHLLTARLSVEPSDRIIVVEADFNVVAEDAQAPQTLINHVADSTLLGAIDQLKGYGVSVIGIDWYLPAAGPEWTATALKTFQSANAEADGPAIYGVCAQPYDGRSGPQQAVPAPHAQAIPKERVGFSNFALDRNGVLRRHLVGNGLGDAAATSACRSEVAFSALVALRYLEQHRPELAPLNYPELITPDPENRLQIGSVAIERINAFIYGGYPNLSPGAFELLLNYREPPDNDLRKAFPHVSMRAVQAGTVEPSEFKDKIVLLGLTAEGLAGDDFATPYGRQYGVTLQAHMVDHLISLALGERRQIRAWGQGGEFAWILLWGAAGGLLAYGWRDRPRWLAGSFLGGLLAIYIACRLAMAGALWLPLWPPLLAFAASHGVVVYTGARFRAAKTHQAGPEP